VTSETRNNPFLALGVAAVNIVKDGLVAEAETLVTAAPVDAEAVLRDAEQRAADLRGLLRRHPTQARQAAARGRRRGAIRLQPVQ